MGAHAPEHPSSELFLNLADHQKHLGTLITNNKQGPEPLHDIESPE